MNVTISVIEKKSTCFTRLIRLNTFVTCSPQLAKAGLKSFVSLATLNHMISGRGTDPPWDKHNKQPPSLEFLKIVGVTAKDDVINTYRSSVFTNN